MVDRQTLNRATNIDLANRLSFPHQAHSAPPKKKREQSANAMIILKRLLEL
jgi:hypothetical protein